MNSTLKFGAMLAFLVAAEPSITFAQTASASEEGSVPGHPRISEVDRRVENQQDRIDAGVKDGQITAKQAAHDETRLTNTEERLSADEAKNGGHITAAEQRNLNHTLNVNSAAIHRQR